MEKKTKWLLLSKFDYRGNPHEAAINVDTIQAVYADSELYYSTDGTVLETSTKEYLLPISLEKFLEATGEIFDIRSEIKAYLNKVQ